eukprot:1576289-Prymnesium_polylepis.1
MHAASAWWPSGCAGTAQPFTSGHPKSQPGCTAAVIAACPSAVMVSCGLPPSGYATTLVGCERRLDSGRVPSRKRLSERSRASAAAGTSPLSMLSNRPSSSSLERSPRVAGTLPVSLLCPKYRTRSEEKLPNQSGTGPLSAFLSRSRCRMAVICTSDCGISPVSPHALMSR